jgi:hypothetical protein
MSRSEVEMSEEPLREAYDQIVAATKAFSDCLHATGEDEMPEGHKDYAKRIIRRLLECQMLYYLQEPCPEPPPVEQKL